MRIFFEVDDIMNANPATVTRLGMIYMEIQSQNWKKLMESYCSKLPETLSDEKINFILENMNSLVGIAFQFINEKCNFIIYLDPLILVNSFLNMFDSQISEIKSKEYQIPANFEYLVWNGLIFGLVWGIGGLLDESSREKFSQFFKEIFLNKYQKTESTFEGIEKVIKNNQYIKILEEFNLFEQVYNRKDNCWIHWIKTIPLFQIPKT